MAGDDDQNYLWVFKVQTLIVFMQQEGERDDQENIKKGFQELCIR
jgi:hypothetical protein